ncbi:hypothetical protein Acr_12g0007040 [Actinidia rufa]|uniref:Uncharacterized protein n=1 Tax=Actinidia rufa TaxID=165716 RepID=A0A7J0FHV3_9ERIC|nr:hypothetical protein Acr_12g0007040 [Actinidia rufa]
MEDFFARRTRRGADGGSSTIYAAADKLEVVTEAVKEKTERDIISLDPYHHGKHEVQFVENLKPMVARVFVSDDGKSMDIFYNKVLLMFDETGSFYSFYIEGSTDTYSDEEFAEMMYLDGCFILGMIESISGQKPSWISKYDEVITRLGVIVWYSISANMVFMLEKQTSFQVLESLTSIKFEDDEGIRMIDEYLDSPVYSDLQFQNKKEVKASKSEKQPLHLLELFRAKYIIGGGEVNQPLHHRKPQTELLHYLPSVRQLTGFHFMVSRENKMDIKPSLSKKNSEGPVLLNASPMPAAPTQTIFALTVKAMLPRS